MGELRLLEVREVSSAESPDLRMRDVNRLLELNEGWALIDVVGQRVIRGGQPIDRIVYVMGRFDA